MDLLGIGEFARQSGLTPKALRLYDELGLLVPATVDPHSGYRRYRPDQLDRARLVVRLRLVGMPLVRIRQLLESPAATAIDLLTSYWRQVEAETTARRAMVSELVRDFRKDITMSPANTPVLHATARSGQGARDEQLDATGTGPRIAAVADGFGEHRPDGRGVAARAIEVVTGLAEQPGGFDRTAMAAAFASAVEVLGKAPSSGTTLTVAAVDSGEILLGHVGDSRALLVHDGATECLTTDHTTVAALVADGRLLPDEARVHPERTLLTRALGAADADEAPEPDLLSVTARPGDRLVLTTKGVHAVLEPDVLTDLVTVPGHQEAAGRIAAAVKAAGAPDNWSVVVVDLT